jgi:hypothetical protein
VGQIKKKASLLERWEGGRAISALGDAANEIEVRRKRRRRRRRARPVTM